VSGAAEETVPARSARSGGSRAAEAAWELVRRVHLGSRKPENWLQLFKFGVVGASGYAINLLVFAGLTQVLDLHHIGAAIGAFCVAVSSNFFWNRHWTFGATEGHAGFQAARFFTVSIVGLGVNLAVLALLVDVLGLAELPSQALAVGVAMPVNFIGNKLWTFTSG
jgi:putative flippase GtrA